MSIEDDDDLDYMLKIVVVGIQPPHSGDSGVGKSNLISRFTKDAFNGSSRPTIGVDFSPKTLKVGDLVVKAQFWDTAGQEKYRSITTSFYKSSDGCVLVYDITDKVSFTNVKGWLKDVREFNDEDLKVILVGNKSDLEERRAVTVDEAKQFAEESKVFFMEVSALTNKDDQVSKAFSILVEEIVHSKESKPEPENSASYLPEQPKPTKIKLTSDGKNEEVVRKGKLGCC